MIQSCHYNPTHLGVGTHWFDAQTRWAAFGIRGGFPTSLGFYGTKEKATRTCESQRHRWDRVLVSESCDEFSFAAIQVKDFLPIRPYLVEVKSGDKILESAHVYCMSRANSIAHTLTDRWKHEQVSVEVHSFGTPFEDLNNSMARIWEKRRIFDGDYLLFKKENFGEYTPFQISASFSSLHSSQKDTHMPVLRHFSYENGNLRATVYIEPKNKAPRLLYMGGPVSLS